MKCKACHNNVITKEYSFFNAIFCSLKCARFYMENVNFSDESEIGSDRYHIQSTEDRYVISRI